MRETRIESCRTWVGAVAFWRQRMRAFVCLLLSLASVSPCAASAAAASKLDYFARVERAPVVVRARIDEVRTVPEVRLVLYRFTAVEVLKGELAPGPPDIVQELVFRSDAPLLSRGTQPTLLLEAFPKHSRYRQHLPARSYLQVAGGPTGIVGPASTDTVRTWLKLHSRSDAGAEGDRLVFLAETVRDAALGDDALAALVRSLDPQDGLAEPAAQAIARAIADRALPLARRRRVIEWIADAKLVAARNALQGALAEPDLAPFARRALAAFGELPPEEALRADLAAADPSIRLAALDTALALGGGERLAFLAGVARDDPDLQVRARAIELLATQGPSAVASLSPLLGSPDPRICHRAAQALASVGTDEAVATLAAQFKHGSYDAQVAAVLALRRVGSESALRTLAEVRRDPPDPRLVKVIDMAAGRPVDH